MMKNPKTWSSFYTPKSLAKQVLSYLPNDFTPECTVDICVGGGNFLSEASRIWGKTDLIGIDIKLDLNSKLNNCVYFEYDALAINDLRSKFKWNQYKSKLVLANPPFGKYVFTSSKLNIPSKFKLIFDEALRLKRLEALMLVSNLSIMSENDYFGAILPDNIFSSQRMNKFKEMFLVFFDDVYIGESSGDFKKSDVKTRVFTGRYCTKQSCKNKNLTDVLKISVPKKLVMYRGIDNSKLHGSGSRKHEVLHFSNSDGKIKNKKYGDITICKSHLITEVGDLLVLRVGRSAGNVFNVNDDLKGKYISDYFYIVKSCNLLDSQLVRLKKQLLVSVRGLTTKYLLKEDIELTIIKFISKDCSIDLSHN